MLYKIQGTDYAHGMTRAFRPLLVYGTEIVLSVKKLSVHEDFLIMRKRKLLMEVITDIFALF